MRHIVQSFQSHVGQRGVHFYDDGSCNFLGWQEVFQFIRTLPNQGDGDVFTEKLTETMANYNPDGEFLAVRQQGTSVSVELYSNITNHVV